MTDSLGLLSDSNEARTGSAKKSRSRSLGCALLLLLILSTLGLIRLETNRLLERRLEKVRADLHTAESLIHVKRTYPFDGQITGEASQFYRAIDWLVNPDSSPSPFTTAIRPKLESGLWSGPSDDLQAHGRVLGLYLLQYRSAKQLRDAEVEAGRAFVAVHGEAVLDLLWSGVLCDHVRWPVDLKEGVNLELGNLHAQRCAAHIALFMASQRPAPEAVEIALMVNAFARDHGHHPHLTGLLFGAETEQLALRSLERRLISEGDAPSSRDLQRIISGLGAMPPRSSQTMKLESLSIDATLANLVSEDGPGANQALLGEGQMLSIPEFILWKWGSLDRYHAKLAAAWNLPLAEAIEAEKGVTRELEDDGSSTIMRLWLPNMLQARIKLLECQARTDLIRLAAAAQLYRAKIGQWPERPIQLAEYFSGNVPKDLLSDGADYKFEVSDEGWSARAATIRSALNIRLPAQRKSKAEK